MLRFTPMRRIFCGASLNQTPRGKIADYVTRGPRECSPIESKRRINAFRRVFALCGMAEGEPVAFLSETQSWELNVHLTELALQAVGAHLFRNADTTAKRVGTGQSTG